MSYLGTNKIGKMYLGSTAIGKAYLGSNLVYDSGPGPQPVTNVAYIRGGADGSYIDTGITADNTTKIIIWARNFNVGTGWLFGSRISAGQSSFGLGSFITNGGCWQFDFNSTNLFYDIFSYSSHFRCYELSSEGLKVDGTTVQSLTPSTFSSGVNIHLFGMNTNGTHTNPSYPFDIIACKIYKNGTLVRDYSATNSSSVGLYDAVSDTVFTNSGSGSFTYGTFDQDAYTPLEYISCANNQWFDSGVYGSYSLRMVVKYMPTNTTARWTGLIGEFSTSKTESCGFSLGTASGANIQLSFRLGTNTTDVTLLTSYSQTNKEMVLIKNNNVATVYNNNTQRGTATKSGVATTFTTTYTLTIGATRNTTTAFTDSKFEGRFYYVGFGSQRNFVPAKVKNVAGMYDTYNDVFYPSASGTNYVAGPEL